jgi:hypothetical protein
MTVLTEYSTMDNIHKGGVTITGKDEKKNYLFSNVYEVAKNSAPYERVVVAKNLEYTIEVSRAEGDSPWYICSHDETVVIMEGAAEIRFIKPADSSVVPPEDKDGAIKLSGQPEGQDMGWINAEFGTQALLPKGAAYQYRPSKTCVLMIQSILGDESIERWADICEA